MGSGWDGVNSQELGRAEWAGPCGAVGNRAGGLGEAPRSGEGDEVTRAMANDGGRKQFWKRSGSKVPGSLIKPGSKPPVTPVKLKKVSTFQEFESNTSDAWDLGDDDDELLAMAAENLNTDVVMETANKVIQNHSKLQEQHKLQEEQLQEDKPVPFSELPSVAYGDNRLVKSVSESHASSSAESVSENSSMQRSQSLPHAPTDPLEGEEADDNTLATPALTEREAFRLDKFKQLLAGPNTNLDELRKLSWSGIPKQVRPITWKLLSGYLPANVDRREGTLQRKRKEYFAFIEQYYDSRNDENHQDTYRQIHIDIPRMNPESLRLQPKVTEIFERILFIWAIRHPASGYVQGINDLVTPFFVVFVCEYIGGVLQCSAVTALESSFNSTEHQPGTQGTATPLLKVPRALNFHFLFDQHGELTSTADHGDARLKTCSSMEYTGGDGSYCCVGRRLCAGRAPIQQKNCWYLCQDCSGHGGEGLHQGHAAVPCENKGASASIQKSREVNSRSGSTPQTCRFYEELHVILGGDPNATPKCSVDTSQEPWATCSNNEEDTVEEENVRQTSGGSILPDSQELFLTLEPIPSEDQLAEEHDSGKGTSAETLSVGTRTEIFPDSGGHVQ
ncbi:TBC1 domain family member 22A isoform X2 [Chrysemys picta bellii]|uniref:TBC1 domain family member 22A isoform X2 n=1 Tax=Chrysemys picta bellii TaxID=8478 RepID=UPI0032B0FC36